MRLSANCRCPERRSDDGRTILEGIRTGLKSCPDLQFLVELSGLEPLTSCMPWEKLTFNTGQMLARDAPCGSMPHGPRPERRSDHGQRILRLCGIT